TSVPVTVELPGRTSPYLVAQVRARVDGIVQKRAFQEGADVSANQPLYRIDAAPYRAALDGAEAALQKAQANLVTTTAQLDRYKVLVSGNAVSKQAYDNAIAVQRQAAADVATAKAAAELARINLGYTSIVSPIAGRSGISLVTQGAYVQASAATLMTTVQQIDPIYVDLQESSAAGLQLRRDVTNGQVTLNGPKQIKVTLKLEDGTKYPLTGDLEFNGSTVDAATGSVMVRARFPNPRRVLLPGMFVRAQIDEGTNDKALLVPVAAVSHDPQGKAMVLVVTPAKKITQRTIEAQSIAGESWVVVAGLSEGEQVVVSGGQKVQPGTSVIAVQAPASTAATASSPPASIPANGHAAADTVAAVQAK
ncbi:MAG: efflux transporter periplasmic adaptor subunit, partial [Herminiimonas sp.]|nr:efflux transporter periplasmic adaptor subunit [Herminiimonas sp.]